MSGRWLALLGVAIADRVIDDVMPRTRLDAESADLARAIADAAVLVVRAVVRERDRRRAEVVR